MGVQRRHAAVDEGFVLLSGVGVPQAVEGDAPVRCGGITDDVTVADNKLLHAVDDPIGGYAVRHQQLMAACRLVQQLLQHHGDALILNGNDTHLSALALHSEGVFPQCPFRSGSVHTEALMDAQSGIAGQIQGEDIVLPSLRHGTAQQLAERGISGGISYRGKSGWRIGPS